jgi:hypothetical protein
MNWLIYVIFIIILIYILCFCYIKLKYHFWSIQPVFHYYNIAYLIHPVGIITREMPIVNKYFNLSNIQTIQYSQLNGVEKQKIINFIKTHFLRTNETNYLPTDTSFSSHFEHNKFDSYISVYYDNQMLFMNNESINNKQLIATMTSRPLYVTIRSKTIPVYYVDYLCVHSFYRKKNIAPQMIQTHEWHQRHNNKDIVVSLFKREGQLNGIVPLTVFTTYAYKKITAYKINNPTLSIILINEQSLHLLMDFIKLHSKHFDCMITPHLSNLLHLIRNKIIYIYVLKSNDVFLSCYFFRNTYTTYFNKPSMECFASISNCPYNELFYQGFTLAYYAYSNVLKCKIILIENTSDNHKIINLIDKKEFAQCPTAYFLYNYATYPVESSKCLIIN